MVYNYRKPAEARGYPAYRSPYQNRLPIAQGLSHERLLCLIDYHNNQFNNFDANKGPTRDFDGLERSADIISACQMQISVRGKQGPG